MNPNRTARIAGFLYGPLQIALAPFGIMYVPTVLVVAGDAVITTENIMANIGLFRLSFATALIVQVTHLVIVLLLYTLLKPVNKDIASLMVIFMLVGIPITMLNELNHFAVLLVLSGADYLKVFAIGQLQALVLMFHGLHEYVINSIASISWGLFGPAPGGQLLRDPKRRGWRLGPVSVRGGLGRGCEGHLSTIPICHWLFGCDHLMH